VISAEEDPVDLKAEMVLGVTRRSDHSQRACSDRNLTPLGERGVGDEVGCRPVAIGWNPQVPGETVGKGSMVLVPVGDQNPDRTPVLERRPQRGLVFTNLGTGVDDQGLTVAADNPGVGAGTSKRARVRREYFSNRELRSQI
jgi:hypothetical protein